MRPNLALTALLLVLSAIAIAAEDNPARRQPRASAADVGIQRVIVKFRASGGTSRVQAQSATPRINALASRTRLSLKQSLAIAPDLQAVHVESLTSGESLAEILARLRADPDVEYAEADRRRYPHAVPNDPLHAGQWYLKNVEASAIDAQTAWDVTTGSTGVVIAVLDTGLLYTHPDLKRATESGRLLPGFDFVSADSGGTMFRTANDGNGRDADPSDPGDWISSADASGAPFNNCTVSDSSWHGTRVSGIIGALSNNGEGVAGITWNTWLLPVRVLGKCGGFDSDVLAGMRWAAGLHVNGIPDNPFPAKIINLSLGAEGACLASQQTVVNELTALGVLVVVSAGNEGGPVDSPANCTGAVGVAGLRHAGTKVGFSSLGPEISLSSPGGNCVNVSGGPCLFSIDTTSNNGATSPGTHNYTDQSNFNVGTSFSAPIVSGIAGLMLAANGNLKSVQLIARLQEGATKPFPTSLDPNIPVCHVPLDASDIQDAECNCTTQTCGAGMADARGAVNAALRPIAAIAVSGIVAPGQNVTLQGGGSGAACNHTVATYAWSIVNPGPNPPAISDANTATATVTAPATNPFVVRLTVTDDAGLQDTADITINPTSATTLAPANTGTNACPTPITVQQAPPPPPPAPPPSSGGGGGGGGGTLDLLWLLVSLVALAGIRWRALPLRAAARSASQSCDSHLRSKSASR